MTPSKAAVITAMADGETTPAGISKVAGVDPATVRVTLSRMLRAQIVIRVRYGAYELADSVNPVRLCVCDCGYSGMVRADGACFGCGSPVESVAELAKRDRRISEIWKLAIGL